MDYQKLFANIHRRPGLLGLDGSYSQFCAFVDGVDFGSDHALLNGFKEWLTTRAGRGDNLGWRALVLNLAFPGAGAVGGHPDRLDRDQPDGRRPALRSTGRVP